MGECGFLEPILGGLAYPGRLSRLIAIEADRGATPDAILRLAALGVAIPEDAERLRDRLRLANAEYDRINSAADARSSACTGSRPRRRPRRCARSCSPPDARRRAMRSRWPRPSPERRARDAAFAAADRFLAEAPEPEAAVRRRGPDRARRRRRASHSARRCAPLKPLDPGGFSQRAGDADPPARRGGRGISSGRGAGVAALVFERSRLGFLVS